MPGTTFITSAARLAVVADVVLEHDAAHALGLARARDVDVVHVAAEHVGWEWTCMSITPAAGLTFGGGGGKPTCAERLGGGKRESDEDRVLHDSSHGLEKSYLVACGHARSFVARCVNRRRQRRAGISG
jgi:hypothetical protein